MAKVILDESCLSMPLIINYNGPKPENLYFELKNMLKRIFGVEDRNIEERELRWDRTTAEEKFSSTIFLTKQLDENVHLFLEIKISGSTKPSKDFEREGRISILIDAKVRGNIFQGNILVEIIRNIFSKGRPSKIEEYKLKCKELVELLEKDIKNFLNITNL